jgi:hypothetical protein
MLAIIQQMQLGKCDAPAPFPAHPDHPEIYKMQQPDN